MYGFKNPGSSLAGMFKSITAVALVSCVAACGGGGGGGGGGSGSPAAPTTPAAASKIFVADTSNSAVASVVNTNPSPGVMVVDRIIVGSNTGIVGADIRGMAYDTSHDRLFLANGLAILVFANASTASGNIAPARTIALTKPAMAIFLDAANDRLYVAGDGNGVDGQDQVQVFDSAGTLNGSPAPNRTIQITLATHAFQMTGIAVDTNLDILYVSGAAGNPTYSPRILSYNSASTSNTSGAADHEIAFSQATFPGPLVSDRLNNRLYMASFGDHTAQVFDNASTASGAARIINPNASVGYMALDVANDRLYATAGNGVSLIPNASTANGVVSTTFAIAPGGSSLNAIAIAQ